MYALFINYYITYIQLCNATLFFKNNNQVRNARNFRNLKRLISGFYLIMLVDISNGIYKVLQPLIRT